MGFCLSGWILPSEEVKDKRNNQADNDGRREWEIEREIAALDIDISGKAAEPGDFRSEGEQQSQDNQNDADKDKRLAEGIHQKALSSLLPPNRAF
jgi:hypothetical protein